MAARHKAPNPKTTLRTTLPPMKSPGVLATPPLVSPSGDDLSKLPQLPFEVFQAYFASQHIKSTSVEALWESYMLYAKHAPHSPGPQWETSFFKGKSPSPPTA